jgi:hypothetical protein
MIETPEPEQYYHGPIVTTCTICSTQREHPPFESHVNLGTQTNLWCGKCKEVVPQFIGIPERKLQPTERKRRARS